MVMLIVWSSVAEAREDERVRIDLQASSLPAAIAELSRQQRISIGTEGALPDVPTRSLHATLTASEALARLLRGSGFVARQVGQTAWRIERAPVARPVTRRAPVMTAAPETGAAEIVVSATKRNLALQDAPVAATVLNMDSVTRLDPDNNTQRVAEQVEGLSVTSEGPGRNRMFLRGVADSPFGGKSQATVALLLDDVRLTYTAPDPDIRLVDVDRVELLKGPQGSLYGSGALGGIYHIVTKRADPFVSSIAGSAAVEAISAGDFGGAASLIVNTPLIPDVAGLRLVAYGEKLPGWLDTGGRPDSNGTTVLGARAGLGIVAGGGWRADVTGFGQWLKAQDSNYTYRAGLRSRPDQQAEPHQNDVLHGSVRLAHEGTTEIVLSTGFTAQDVDDRFDATQGAESFGLGHPQTLDDNGHFSMWDSEARVSGSTGALGWLGGLSNVQADQNTKRVLQSADGSTLTVESVDRRASEAALFGEATLALSGSLDATVGARLFHTALHDDRSSTSAQGTQETRRTGVTPSASMSWHPEKNRLFYLRYGSAARQGGTTIGVNGEVKRLDEDELRTIEGGWREVAGALHLDLGVYHSWWSDIQSDVLQANGLIETANVGNGTITGAEMSLEAGFRGGWRLTGGGTLQSALLTTNASGFELNDRQLPVVPAWTLRGALTREFHVASWATTLTAAARYVGPARLSFDPALDRPMGNYLDTRLSLEARRQNWTLALEGTNLLGSRGDTFAYGNPFRILQMHEFVTQAPTSVRLALSLTP